MDILPPNLENEDLFLSSSTPIVKEQLNLLVSTSTNVTTTSVNKIFGLHFETMRIILLTVATLIIILCLIVCISICVCLCLKRKHKSKHNKKKDQLLPEQTGKNSNNKSSKNLLTNPTITNGKQSISLPTSTSNQTKVNSNSAVVTTGKPFYYDNLDDIPFIDESRPTSVVDITQV